MKRILFVIFMLISINIVFAWLVKDNIYNLVKKSELIIIGETISQESRIEIEDKQKVVYTYSSVKIDSIIYGTFNNNSVNVKNVGGIVGDIGTWSNLGVPLKLNEKVLLFLNPSKDKCYQIANESGKLPATYVNNVQYFDTSNINKNDKIVNGKSITQKKYLIEEISRLINNRGEDNEDQK